MSSRESKFVVFNAQGVTAWTASKSVRTLATLDTGVEKLQDIFVSKDGVWLAVLLKNTVSVYRTENLEKPKWEWPVANSRVVAFSPKSTWAVVYAVQFGEEKNQKVFNLATGKLVHEWLDKKRELLQWSLDESLAYRWVGGEVLFFEDGDYTRCPHKLSQRLNGFALTTNKGSGCHYVAAFQKGAKGAPCTIKVHGYPHLENTVASKSFFKVDWADIKWNYKGDAMLVMASNDVDTSGQSYYGETLLHFLDLKGTTATVTGKKEGTVSAAEWLPSNEGFITIQGKIPSAITLFNNKAESVFSFGEGPVNSIYISPFANLVAITGFGNLSGYVYVWNLKTKTLISHFKAVDTTTFTWASDGLHLISGTHYDRLKQGNGFKVWDYLGNLIHTEDCRDEGSVSMYKMIGLPDQSFPEPNIPANAKGKILAEQPVKKYVPPNLRKPGEKPIKFKTTAQAEADAIWAREKKIKNLSKKLQQIEFLKQALAEGKELEKNQLEKIEKEDELVNELNALKLEQTV